MKVIAVLSSPSKNGNTAVLAREALNAAKASGADTEEIFLADYKIEFCRGCMQCMRTGTCPLNDDFERLKAKVYNSDGIILGSPSYGMAPNARMKNFLIDRMGMFTVYTSSLSGKYFLGFSTAGAVGADKVAKELAYSSTFGIFKKAYASGYLGATLGTKKFEMKRIEDYPDKMKMAGFLGKKLVQDIRSKKNYHFQNWTGNLISRLFLKNLMIRNIIANKDSSMKGVYENLKEKKWIEE